MMIDGGVKLSFSYIAQPCRWLERGAEGQLKGAGIAAVGEDCGDLWGTD